MSNKLNAIDGGEILRRLSGYNANPVETINKLDKQTQQEFYNNLADNIFYEDYQSSEIITESFNETEKSMFGHINYQTRNAIYNRLQQTGINETKKYYYDRIDKGEFKTLTDKKELRQLINLYKAMNDIDFYIFN